VARQTLLRRAIRSTGVESTVGRADGSLGQIRLLRTSDLFNSRQELGGLQPL
jgi:hypothetical protein